MIKLSALKGIDLSFASEYTALNYYCILNFARVNKIVSFYYTFKEKHAEHVHTDIVTKWKITNRTEKTITLMHLATQKNILCMWYIVRLGKIDVLARISREILTRNSCTNRYHLEKIYCLNRPYVMYLLQTSSIFVWALLISWQSGKIAPVYVTYFFVVADTDANGVYMYIN